MPFPGLFIDNLYRCLLDSHLAILLAFAVFGLAGSVVRARSRWRWIATSVLLFLVAFSQTVLQQERPSVYFDEYYYASTAYNMAVTGRVAPFCEQGYPAKEQRLDYPNPPYPAGWPHLVSWALRLTGRAERWAEIPVWHSAVVVNKVLFCLAPLVLFCALELRYSYMSAAFVALVVPAVPALQRLAQGGSAELAALFSLLLAYWSWCLWRRERKAWQLAWLAVALAWVAEMRPEGLIWCALALVALLAWLKCQRIAVSRGAVGLALALLALGALPAALVLINHPSAANHHFEAIPRAQMTMGINRVHNVLNNAWALLDNKIWPLGLTALAALGLWLSRERSRWIWLGAALALTAFLSWFPFGDYDCVYSSDTWRFTYHLMLPAFALGAEACFALESRPRSRIWIMVGVCLAWVGSGFFCTNQFLARVLPLEHLLKQGISLRSRSLGNPVVVKDLSHYHLLRFGCALPATLAPLEDIPPDGAFLFRVLEPDSGGGSEQNVQKYEQIVHKSVQKFVNRVEIGWETGEKQSFVHNVAEDSEAIILEQTVWQRIAGDLNHYPAVEVYYVRKGL